jgi:AcrR family transcriptional regulator
MPLDREVVVRTALDLLDSEGLEGLTLRKIAAALQVKAPALYWHFQNKQQLLDEMATAMARDATSSAELTGPWHEQLRTMAVGLRRMLLSRRDGARLFGGTYMTDSAPLVAGEPLLRSLTDAGADLRTAVAVNRTISCYAIGHVLEEQGVVRPSGARDHRFDPDARRARLDGEQAPLTAAASDYLFGDFDRSFTDGLELIIAGFAARLAAGQPTSRPNGSDDGH